jgi:hypothetical protein
VIGVELMQRIIENVNNNEKETQNSRVKAAIYLSCIAGICSVLVFILVSEQILYLLCPKYLDEFISDHFYITFNLLVSLFS